MKTKIVTLESHDDLISVRDKFSWAKTPRILLVWPKYEKITLRLLDLQVLRRHADSLGAQLGLVTRRANVRRDAESLGIPVFKSTAAAQRDLWPDSAPRSRRTPKTPRRGLRRIRDIVYEKEAPWRTSLLGRVLTFTVGVIAVLTVASLFVPHAALTLYPEAQTQSVVIPVSAGESIEAVSVTGAIPSQSLSITVDGEQSAAVASRISVPKSKSQGIAVFKNLGQTEIKIRAGTIISTAVEQPIKFVTLHDTLLDPGLDKFVDVPIEALQSGASGNVPADSVIVVEGPLGLSIAVTNPNPITGGADSQVVGATDTDREKLRKLALENLRSDAESKLRAQLDAADLLLPDTFKVVKVVEESFEPQAGQPSKTLTLTMQVEFSAQYILAEDLKQLSSSALDSSITKGFEPFGEMKLKTLTKPKTDSSGVTHFELEVTRTLLRQVDTMQVFSMVRGHNPKQVSDKLMKDFALRKEPKVIITPSWWPWLPLIPFNLSVEMR
ncbi:MAG: baseplate J/gp47 family protein [Chloroflexi bacterium]|nr:baseplate J/gp47 family protein [Chloroflexota bacterium]